MSGPRDIEIYARGLESHLGCTVEIKDGDSVSLRMGEHQPVTFAVDGEKGLAALGAPVAGTADLDRALALALLCHNFPSDTLAGGMLVASARGTELDLVSVIPLAAVTPLGLAERLAALAAAAERLARWIDRRASGSEA